MTAATACSTPLPPYRPLSPSRRSTASKAPVDAPEGTAARAVVPSSRRTSTSTVGLPRESRISRAPMSSMVATAPPYRRRRRPFCRPGAPGGPAGRGSAQVEEGTQVTWRRRAVGEHLVVQLPVRGPRPGGAEPGHDVPHLVVAHVIGGELGGGQQGAAPLARRLALLLVPAIGQQAQRLGLGHSARVHPDVEH